MHFNPFGTKHQKNKGDWFNLTHIPDCKLWLDASPSPANVSNVKSGNAAQFIAANSEYLSVADNAALSMGDVDFTLAGWVYFDTLPAIGSHFGLIGKWESVVSKREYLIFVNNSAGVTTFRFQVRNTLDTATSEVAATTFGAVSVGAWYFVTAYHNTAADLIGISVNDGAFNTAANTGGVQDGTADFEIGRYNIANYFNGRAHDVIIAKQIYTAAEITFLYNDNNGRRFEDLGLAGTDGANINAASGGVAYFKLGEESGTRADSWGANTLTDNNTVTQNDGVSLKDAVNNDSVRQWTDLSGNGFNATQTGNVTTKSKFITGVQNGKPSIRTDGVNDYLAFATPFSYSDFTYFCAFIRRTDTGAVEILFDNRDSAADGFSFQIDANDKLSVIYNAITVTGATSIATATAYVLGVVADGTNITIYLNGVQDGQAAQSGSISITTNAVIGARNFTSQTSFVAADYLEQSLHNRGMNAGELARATRYLGRRWGIAVS